MEGSLLTATRTTSRFSTILGALCCPLHNRGAISIPYEEPSVLQRVYLAQLSVLVVAIVSHPHRDPPRLKNACSEPPSQSLPLPPPPPVLALAVTDTVTPATRQRLLLLPLHQPGLRRRRLVRALFLAPFCLEPD